MNKCFILITLIALIYCHKAGTTKDAPVTQMNQLTKLQQSKNVFLLHTNLTKTQIEQILNTNITADFDNDDRDDLIISPAISGKKVDEMIRLQGKAGSRITNCNCYMETRYVWLW